MKYYIFVFLSFFNSLIFAQTSIKIEKGVLDLRDWNSDELPILPLNGEWSFYWQELLTQEEINQRKTKNFLKVPHSWSGNSPFKKQPYPSKGYATYHLKVLLPKKFQKELAINIPRVSTACRLYINDKLLFQAGVVSQSSELAHAQYLTQIVSFNPEGNDFDLIIQVSNYHYQTGGLRNQFLLGISKEIHKIREWDVMKSLFFMGFILMMALFNFGLYACFPEDKSPLYFGVVCLFNVVRALFTNDYLINTIIQLPWDWVVKIEYLTVILPILSFSLFLQQLYPKYFSQFFLQIVKWAVILLAIFCISFPPFYVSHIQIAFQLLAFVGIMNALFPLGQ